MLQGKATWHLAFGSTPDVREALLASSETVLVEYLFRHAYDQTTFSGSLHEFLQKSSRMDPWREIIDRAHLAE